MFGGFPYAVGKSRVHMKYSDVVVDWLCELGYTHCFFVAGGNIMHLLDGVRKRMTRVPFVLMPSGLSFESGPNGDRSTN